MANNLLIAFLLNLLSTWMGAFGALFFKLGSSGKLTVKGLLHKYKLLLGFLFYGVSTVPFIYSLKFEPLSVVYPFVSMSYVWIMLLSKAFLNEEINTKKKIAVMFLIVGISLIGLSAR